MTRIRKLIHVVMNRYWLRAMIRYGVAASAEHGEAMNGLGMLTVIDVGANRGQFSLLARRVFPNARVIAFEPLTRAQSIYRKVFAGDSKVSLHHCALGQGAATTDLHIAGADDSSSLLPITELQFTTFPGTEEVGTEQVYVVALPDVVRSEDIRRPALMKLDVQGFELNALKGAEPLMDCFDYVYCECSFVEMYEGQALVDEIIAWLQPRGFRVRGVYNVTYNRSGKAVQADFLFTRL